MKSTTGSETFKLHLSFLLLHFCTYFTLWVSVSLSVKRG